MEGGAIAANSAILAGGGVWSRGRLRLIDVDVDGNSSSESGGGIYSTGFLAIEDSRITTNSAGTYGGGMFLGETGTVSIGDSLINANTAMDNGR